MDNNNLNQQESAAREPLPQFGMTQDPNFGQQAAPSDSAREPLPQMDFQTAPPTFEEQQPEENPEVEECVNAAFGKCLAAAIMAWFPIASIVAIFFGATGLKMVKAAAEKANQLGVQPGGKNVAARVLGMVGQIAGIVVTINYGFVFLATIGEICLVLIPFIIRIISDYFSYLLQLVQ